MKKLLSSLAALVALASLSLAHDKPASLLLFPEFDNRIGRMTLLTVTNTNDDIELDQTGNFVGTVRVEYVYINGDTCQEFNRTETLTPNDTLTVVSGAHNPNHERGFLYVFAKSRTTGRAIGFDYLIGQELTLDSFVLFNYAYNPINYLAAVAPGANTDVDNDGTRDLNGLEYQKSGDEILIPRFFGQNGVRKSDLVLINLTGGSLFTATIGFLIYNDNEEVFSAYYQFSCWEKVRLSDISSAFDESFLDGTNNAPNEVLGASHVETGWIRINGLTATSSATTISNPAILAILDETVGPFGAADAPYMQGENPNGDLLPHGPFGDNN